MKLKELELSFWFDLEHAGASKSGIQQLEIDLGFELPSEFKEALSLRDGGVSTYSSFQRDEYYVPIPAFFTLDALRRAEKNREAFGTPAKIVVIASGGHEWLGLDYRDGVVPKIVFQEDEESELEIVAECFEDLLDGLVEE